MDHSRDDNFLLVLLDYDRRYVKGCTLALALVLPVPDDTSNLLDPSLLLLRPIHPFEEVMSF